MSFEREHQALMNQIYNDSERERQAIMNHYGSDFEREHQALINQIYNDSERERQAIMNHIHPSYSHVVCNHTWFEYILCGSIGVIIGYYLRARMR